MEHALSPPATTPREAIVAAARGWIGTPYQHQGSLRGVGCDCLGLVRGVWREVIGAEPAAVVEAAYARMTLELGEPDGSVWDADERAEGAADIDRLRRL